MSGNLLAQVNNPAISGTSGLNGEQFISKVVGVVIAGLFVVGVAIFMFRLVTGGLSWMTAGADKAKLEDAKNTIIHAVLGLVILLGIFGIVNFLVQFIGFNFTYFDISYLGVGY